MPQDQLSTIYDEHSEATLAVQTVNQWIQAAAGRVDPIRNSEASTQQGMRYIDFLVPGVLGMHLLGGGLWGIGSVVVDMRIRKLLKALAATPVRRWKLPYDDRRLLSFSHRRFC